MESTESKPPWKRAATPDLHLASSNGAKRLRQSSELCKRCNKIDLEALLTTDKTKRPRHVHMHGDNEPLAINLGSYSSLSLDQKCSLCALLASLLPRSVENLDRDIFLLSARSLHRLDVQVPADIRQYKGNYANIIYAGSKHLYCHQTANSAGVVSDRDSRVMRAKMINPTQVDIAAVTHWLEKCTRLHGMACVVPLYPERKDIRLIDVQSRRVIPHPRRSTPDYLCLSYVWGPTRQSIKASRLGLKTAPTTITDAMEFVRRLGKRYLWVDSVCVDQDDEKDKKKQIAIMDRIYSGAWATIVSLDGDSASSILPRVNSSTPPTSQGVDRTIRYENSVY